MTIVQAVLSILIVVFIVHGLVDQCTSACKFFICKLEYIRMVTLLVHARLRIYNTIPSLADKKASYSAQSITTGKKEEILDKLGCSINCTGIKTETRARQVVTERATVDVLLRELCTEQFPRRS